METLRYYMFDFWETESDPRISHYPLMNGGPWAAWSIVVAYVYFVKRLGPALMKNREPFHLKKLIVTYNIFMILVNLYFFYELAVTYRLAIDMNILNFERSNNPNSSTPLIAHTCRLAWLYLMSKYLDLVETVFYVLRKKSNQISNLHVYHHAIVPLLVHMFIKISPEGGPAVIFPLLNTFIHSIMYTYYTLSALGLYQYTWWKKYVTQLQLAQFIIFGIFGWLFCLNQRGFPKICTYLGIIQPIVFFGMFYSFYKRAYTSKKDDDGKQSQKSKMTTTNGHSNGLAMDNNGTQPATKQDHRLATSCKSNCSKTMFTNGNGIGCFLSNDDYYSHKHEKHQ